MFYFAKAIFFGNNIRYKNGANMEKERTKMCPICNGIVAMQASICPYCATDLYQTHETITQDNPSEDVESLSYEETLSSLYPPPYKPKAIDTSDSLDDEQDTESDQEESEEIVDEKSSLIPTILFWAGVNIFLFSLFLVIFSEGGYLHLQWSAAYWFLYTIAALPLLYFGFKGLQKLD